MIHYKQIGPLKEKYITKIKQSPLAADLPVAKGEYVDNTRNGDRNEICRTKKKWLQKNIECSRKIAERTKDKELAIALEKFIHRCEKEIKENDKQIQ